MIPFIAGPAFSTSRRSANKFPDLLPGKPRSEPREVAAHVCYALKAKSLNCLGANVRDRFLNRIRRKIGVNPRS